VTYREAHLAMEMLADTEAMVSLEIVEINPVMTSTTARPCWAWSWCCPGWEEDL